MKRQVIGRAALPWFPKHWENILSDGAIATSSIFCVAESGVDQLGADQAE
jgi:hypothetical protein